MKTSYRVYAFCSGNLGGSSLGGRNNGKERLRGCTGKYGARIYLFYFTQIPGDICGHLYDVMSGVQDTVCRVHFKENKADAFSHATKWFAWKIDCLSECHGTLKLHFSLVVLPMA